MKTKKITLISLLTTIALIIFMLEAQLPPLTAIPGIKLGLANIVTLFALYYLGKCEALCVLLLRICLASIFAGQAISFIYSLSGGLLCLGAMFIASLLIKPSNMWITSVIGAVFHNTGQILIAVIITKTAALWFYFPILLTSGLIAGFFTGICCQFIYKKLIRFKPPDI